MKIALTIIVVMVLGRFCMAEDILNPMKKATFAGGCFWCMVKPFDQFDGVKSVVSGYTGGTVADPTYKQVCEGKTGHVEAVEITFDPNKITYDQLLTLFWRQIDPTDPGGQFSDRGTSYRSAIFYHDEEQRLAAERSKEQLEKSKRFDKPIATQILPAKEFYPAEKEHQNFYKTNPERYTQYSSRSGRIDFQAEHWDKKSPNRTELKKKLSPMQFEVTQDAATEPPFKNEFWDNHAEGIYVDIVDGTPLFSSKDKFDSGCGWPSFAKPLGDTKVVEKPDYTRGRKRTEVRSFTANSHLGHVFEDGPKELGGLRYCINSASLRFIPKDKMKEAGYGDLLSIFD